MLRLLPPTDDERQRPMARYLKQEINGKHTAQ